MTQPQSLVAQPMRYLDRALDALRDLGLLLPPPAVEATPITGLLSQLGDLDPDRVTLIARVLNQATVFNEVVREQIRVMEIAQRYEGITESFNSIRDDAKEMVNQLDDGRISTFEALRNMWADFRRGDISTRFQRIRDTYLDVSKDTKSNIDREKAILEAYRDFRGALKQAEVLTLEVLQQAEGKLAVTRSAVEQAGAAVDAAGTVEPAQRAQREMARDEALRALQNEEGRYQICKDLADNMVVSYNTSEVIMARLVQTTSAKERVYQQSVAFFSTNEAVLTALSASFAGLHGLHESTQTLDAMKQGVNQSLEVLADIGGKVQEEALRAGYGPTVSAVSVQKLIDSVVNYQDRSREIVAEMREAATRNAEEIRRSVEEAKQRMTRLAQQGAALALPPQR